MNTVMDKKLSPRTMLALAGFVDGPLSRIQLVEKLQVVPDTVVASAIRRLQINKLIEVVGKPPGVKTAALSYGITKLGLAFLSKGPTMRDRVLESRHGGTYSKASPQDWVAPRADRNVMTRGTYVAPKVTLARSDAEEHLQHKSKGT